jgi:D-alanyl-D-alanine carboxypeptidase
MQRTVDGRLQPAAAEALTASRGRRRSGGCRCDRSEQRVPSFASQTRTYNGYVNSLGRDAADQQSARPGFSEHQTGLATDVAACDSGCGAIESFGGTRQGAWVAANAWRFGFIVRYESGYTSITGYEAEPWHLRYIGPELRRTTTAGSTRSRTSSVFRPRPATESRSSRSR